MKVRSTVSSLRQGICSRPSDFSRQTLDHKRRQRARLLAFKKEVWSFPAPKRRENGRMRMAWDRKADPGSRHKLDRVADTVRATAGSNGLSGMHRYKVADLRRKKPVRPVERSRKEARFEACWCRHGVGGVGNGEAEPGPVTRKRDRTNSGRIALGKSAQRGSPAASVATSSQAARKMRYPVPSPLANEPDEGCGAPVPPPVVTPSVELRESRGPGERPAPALSAP